MITTDMPLAGSIYPPRWIQSPGEFLHGASSTSLCCAQTILNNFAGCLNIRTNKTRHGQAKRFKGEFSGKPPDLWGHLLAAGSTCTHRYSYLALQVKYWGFTRLPGISTPPLTGSIPVPPQARLSVVHVSGGVT